MTKTEIKSELEDMIYMFKSLENYYAANRLQLVLDSLIEEWNLTDYFANEIDNILNYEDTISNLNNITIYE